MGNVGNFNSACNNNRKRMRYKKQVGTHSTRKSNSGSRIEKFMKLSRERPTFFCVVCNRCFYFRTAVHFNPKKDDIALADLVYQVSASQKAASVGLAIVASKNLEFPHKLSQIFLNFSIAR